MGDNFIIFCKQNTNFIIFFHLKENKDKGGFRKGTTKKGYKALEKGQALL